MARDVSNSRQNKRLEQLNKLREEADDAAFAAVLEAGDGRRVLTRIARDNHWMGAIWDATSPRQTDFNAGQQEAARSLMAWAERVSPEQFMAALAEATKRDVEMAEQAKAALTPEPSEESDDG
jgi:hypothetical protein